MTEGASVVPAARITGLITTEVDGELLVYDQSTHTIHHLNAASAAVWRLCDGQRTLKDVALESGMTLGAAQVALHKLESANLLAKGLDSALRVTNPSRRRLLKGAVGAGAAATLVSISAPSASAAVSCLPPGAFCDASNFINCCSQGCQLSTPEGVPVNQCL